MSSLRSLARAAALAFMLSSAASPAQVTGAAKEFFLPYAATLLKSGGPSRAPGVVSDVTPIRFNAEQMLALQPGDEIQLTLPNAISRTVIFELAQAHGGGIHSWVGHFKQRGKDNRVILTTGPGGSYGVIDTPEGSYRIIPGDGHDWLVDMTLEKPFIPLFPVRDDGRVPPRSNKSMLVADGKASFQTPILGVNSLVMGKLTFTPTAVIDLMVVVTKTLANRLGSNLMTRLYFLVTRANTTYSDSDVAMTLRMVKLATVDYPDSGEDDVALDAITPVGAGGTGVFANIETQRIAAAADLVSLMRDGSSFGGSGVAWLSSTSPDPKHMYSVVTGCVSGCESVFIHELGHNMGNKHDRNTDSFQDGGTSGGAFPYAYGYAFCKSGALTCVPNIASGTPGTCSSSQPECLNADNSNFRDIMAYFQASTQEVYRFSNPAISCKTANGDGFDRPCGISELAGNSANTALSMNLNRVAISAVKTQVSPAQMPGSLQFTQAGFNGSEGGTITFTVSRVRDSVLVGGGGAVSVAYTLTGATATAGTDFVAAGGTLNWADGDFANKTFSVAINTDGVVEPVETFTATLLNPTGAPGVFLGYPTTAAGIILEVWPPGGVMPVGFVTPNGSAGAWSVATDQFFEGTSSLRSAQVFGDLSNYTNSDLVYSGNFAAGQAVFAYRVSSYQNYGVFEFMVDGVTILSDTGETGWKTFLFDVTAGNHTLTWRFKNRLSSACNSGWTPPPQGGSACADRVWIDSVGLPLAPDPPRLANISTRGQVQTGFNVMIGGFVISGASAKTVVVRATGPSLTNFGVTGALANPTLQLVRSSDQSVIATNDDWGSAANVAQISSSGFAPSNPLESAIYATLQPGAYTAIVSGVGGVTGVGLVEVYEVDHPEIPLINISTRGKVQTGFDVMIGGFVIQGSGPETVVIRAIGPSLANFGVSGALANPTMSLVRMSDNATIAINDDWGSASNAAQISSSGFAPSNALESAIMMSLAPGAYTAVVSGVGGGTGVGLVEVYKVGP